MGSVEGVKVAKSTNLSLTQKRGENKIIKVLWLRGEHSSLENCTPLKLILAPNIASNKFSKFSKFNFCLTLKIVKKQRKEDSGQKLFRNIIIYLGKSCELQKSEKFIFQYRKNVLQFIFCSILNCTSSSSKTKKGGEQWI